MMVAMVAAKHKCHPAALQFKVLYRQRQPIHTPTQINIRRASPGNRQRQYRMSGCSELNKANQSRHSIGVPIDKKCKQKAQHTILPLIANASISQRYDLML